MGSQKTYILTVKLYKTLKKKIEKRKPKKPWERPTRERKFVCQKCKFPFQIGDIIVSKPIRDGKRVFYHQSCYENMFYDVDLTPEEERELEFMIKTPVLISNN